MKTSLDFLAAEGGVNFEKKEILVQTCWAGVARNM